KKPPASSFSPFSLLISCSLLPFSLTTREVEAAVVPESAFTREIVLRATIGPHRSRRGDLESLRGGRRSALRTPHRRVASARRAAIGLDLARKTLADAGRNASFDAARPRSISLA